MNQDLEKNLLRHILKDSNKALISAERLPNEAFVWSTSRTLYRVIVWSARTYSTSPNSTEVQAILTQQNIQEELASSVLVLWNELAIETPDDSGIEFLCDRMLEYHKKNLIEQALRNSVQELSDGKVDQSIETLKNSLNRIESKFRTEISRSGQLDEFGDRVYNEYVDRKANPSKYEGLKFGISGIDKYTGGLVNSSVSILLAPPKEFKTAFAMTFCYNVAKRGVYSLYFANEGTIELFYQRFAAMELSIPLSHIKDGTMTDLEESRWLQFITSVREGKHQILNKIYFAEVPLSLSTTSYLAELLKKLREEGKNVGLVILDHFGRMGTTDKTALQDWQKKGVVAEELCNLARSERIPFFLLTHVKAQSAKDALEDNADFSAYDIERSGQPLKDVDYVFSWRIENRAEFDANGKKGFARLSLVLSRHSETCSSTLQINGKFMQIQEIQIGGTSTPTI